MTQIAHPELDGIGKYEYGWSDKTDAGSNSRRGLNEEVVRDISSKKNEPQWMLDLRLKGLSLFEKKPMPSWGSDLSGIFFDTIKYFVRSTEKQATSWEDLPDDIKNTYDRLGIPEAEKKRLVAGVAAQYESEVVYHSIREDLEKQGVLFLDTDTALRTHEDIFKEYFGTELPEEMLNVQQQAVIVAAQPDLTTERVVKYLAALGVPINLNTFEVFIDGAQLYLSPNWAVDLAVTQGNVASVDEKGPWNGHHYGSFGHGQDDRNWEDARKYGFFSAGGGSWYSRSLSLLQTDDIIWVQSPSHG